MTYLSGFCNPSNPDDSHRRCHGAYRDTPCSCACHTTPTGPALKAVLDLRSDADDLIKIDLDMQWEDLVHLQHHARLATTTLRNFDAVLTQHIAQQWRDADLRDAQEVDGVGAVLVRRGKKRTKWDHEALAPAVIDAHLQDAAGEIPNPFTIARWILDAAAPAYWRSTALKSIGLRADDYCESAPGVTSVQITTNDKAAS